MLWLPVLLTVISLLINANFDRTKCPFMKIVRLNILYILENSVVTAPLVSFAILINNIRQRLAMLNKHLRYAVIHSCFFHSHKWHFQQFSV